VGKEVQQLLFLVVALVKETEVVVMRKLHLYLLLKNVVADHL